MKNSLKKITIATSSKSKVHVGLTGSPKSLPLTTPHHHASPKLPTTISQPYPKTMTTYTNPTTTATLFHPQTTTTTRRRLLPTTRATFSGDQSQPQTHRRKFVTTLLTTSISFLSLNPINNGQVALAESWGTRSFIKERFFEPGLSPEDAVARIRQTREGLHSIRNMLETMSWRYVLFYIRLKAAYLSQDLKNAMAVVPESNKGSYVKAANELVDNMSEFDRYVRSPKVYESYLYYEKTLKSIDDLVAVLAA